MKKYIIRAWKGEERLWIVFWLYGVLGLSFLTILQIFLQAVGTSAEKNGHSTTGIVIIMSFITIFAIAYIVWAICSLWRCAFNAKWKWLGYLSRGYVLWSVLSSLILIIALALHLTGSST